MGSSAFGYHACRCAIQVVSRLLWGLRFQGRDNIPRTDGAILACNHESFLDPFVVGCGIPRQSRYLARRTLAMAGEKRSPFKTRVLAYLGVVELDRDSGGPEGVRRALEMLEAGYSVLMFPEGTRTSDGEVQRFKAGIGLLALRSGCPVLPVFVEGSAKVWGRGRKRPRIFRWPIRVRYGKTTVYQKPWKARDVAADLRDRVLALRGDGQRDTARDGAGPHGDAGDGPSR